jgi:DnaJ family protein C protein 28
MTSIEEHIRRAMEEGKFDGLSGKGKPLNLDENPYEDPGWRTAYRMLKNGGFSLPWLESRQEIDQELEEHRKRLRQAWEWRSRALERGEKTTAVEAEWQRKSAEFRAGLTTINKRVRDYNLETPSGRFQMRLLNIEAEIEAVKEKA